MEKKIPWFCLRQEEEHELDRQGIHAVYLFLLAVCPSSLSRKLCPQSGHLLLPMDMFVSKRRQAPGSVKVHLNYGRLTVVDVKSVCEQKS